MQGSKGKEMDAAAVVLPASIPLYAALLSMERFFYGLVWHRPKTAALVLKKDKEPETIFRLVWCFKCVQVAVFASWWYHHFGWTDFDLTAVPPYLWAASALLLGVGQVLNASAWSALGKAGVCYGFSYPESSWGKQVRWVTGWPYNVLDSPQYIGAIATVWGLFLFTSAQVDDWWVLPAIETFLYALSIHVLEA